MWKTVVAVDMHTLPPQSVYDPNNAEWLSVQNAYMILYKRFITSCLDCVLRSMFRHIWKEDGSSQVFVGHSVMYMPVNSFYSFLFCVYFSNSLGAGFVLFATRVNFVFSETWNKFISNWERALHYIFEEILFRRTLVSFGLQYVFGSIKKLK